MAQNRMIIYSLVLIALMLLRPQGLFGSLPRLGGGGRTGGIRKVPKPGESERPATN
jgi:hypothetical protein